MPGVRVSIDDFALANPLYAGATVTVYTVDPTLLTITTTLAPVYQDLASTTLLGNPQTLDGEGKWQQPVYVDQPVIMQIGNAGAANHQTGITGPIGAFRGDWVSGELYFTGDTVRDGPAGDNTSNIYYCAEPHTSTVFSADLAALRWTLYVSLAASLVAAVAAQVPATAPAGNLVSFGTQTIELEDTGINTTGGALSITAAPTFSIIPTTNAFPTLVCLSVQATTQAANEREFLVGLGLTANKGKGLFSPTGDKAALYVGVEAQLGVGQVWAFNTVTTLDAGSNPDNAYGYELDFNNNYASWGTGTGVSGLAAPVAYGLAITGAGAFSSTAAFAISGPGTQIWQRGIVVGSGSVAQAAFQDVGNSTISIDLQGGHSYGIDLVNASCTAGYIRLPNGGYMVGRNAANTADIELLRLDTNNNLVIGGSGLAGQIEVGTILPAVDNTYQIGSSASRLSFLYSAGGVITTSDPAGKTDVEDLPPCLPLLEAIAPKTWRNISGGAKIEETEKDGLVQATELQEWDEPSVEIVNGVPILGTKHVVRDVSIFDEVQVVDADGSPVWIDIPRKPAVVDAAGRVVRLAQAAQRLPHKHRVPRMVPGKVTVSTPVDQPGKRTHWGFMAPDVRDALATSGRDCAAYVLGEDGRHHLNMQELIPINWQASRELLGLVRGQAAQIAALADEIAALKADNAGKSHQ